jgi:hypothetical protein
MSIMLPSQRAQIFRHVAEFHDHFGVAEFARGGITRAAACDARMWPSLRESASARIIAATGLKHSVGLPAAIPSSLATNGSAT